MDSKTKLIHLILSLPINYSYKMRLGLLPGSILVNQQKGDIKSNVRAAYSGRPYEVPEYRFLEKVKGGKLIRSPNTSDSCRLFNAAQGIEACWSSMLSGRD